MSGIGMLEAGGVTVHTTENRGSTPAEVAKRCVDRIIAVSDAAPPEIGEQAKAFRDQIEIVVAHYMRSAVRSDRSTIETVLTEAGYPELAKMIKGL